MDFQDINAFAHVARLGSFSRGAASLRTAQSALSRRVLRLEHQLGTKLLERHSRGIRLTHAGEILLREADGLIDTLRRIERLIGEDSQVPSGVLRLALPPTTGQVLGPAFVSQCRELYPRLELQIREGMSGAIHKWIEDDEVDLAVLYDPEPSMQGVVIPLLKEPLYLIAPQHSPDIDRYLTTKGEFPVRALGEIPLILPSRSHSIRASMERYAAEHGFRLLNPTQVDGIRTTTGLVEAGLGYTIYSYAGVYEPVVAGILRLIPLKPQLHWTLAIAHKHDLSPSLSKSIGDMIKREMHTLVERGLWHGTLIVDKEQAA